MLDVSVPFHGNSQQREETTMRYTKPHVLATLDANRVVQHGGDPASMKLSPNVDNAISQTQSTTGAYEADE
jgi:hypothetical protein